MSTKICYCALVLSVLLGGCHNGTAPPQPAPSSATTLQYASPEHFMLGSAVNLQFTGGISRSGDKAKLLILPLSNGSYQELYFADLVYLAGDFIGDPQTHIGGHDLATNMQNFKTNFDVMFSAPAKDYLPGIMGIVNQELLDNYTQITNHQPLNIPSTDNIRFNCITGGGCNRFTFLVDFGLYMQLAASNYDHFGQDALDSYQAGHRLALAVAHAAKNDADLRLAYAYEGFADHFLTDLFAAGHLRTPRRAIADWCTKAPTSIAAYLGKVMHDIDNQKGIYINNNDGTKWYAYGDNNLFIEDNTRNNMMTLNALQKSVTQIYQTYLGNLDETSAMAAMQANLPNVALAINDPMSLPALFKVGADGHSIYEYNPTTASYAVVTNCITTAMRFGWQRI